MNGRKWTVEEDDYIVNNYKGYNAGVIADHITRTKSAVFGRVDELRKRGIKIEYVMYGGSVAWKKEEVDALEELWGSFTLNEIAYHMRMEPGAVQAKGYAEFGGLEDNREYLKPLEVAEIMGVTHNTIYTWMRNGFLMDHRKSRKSGIRKDDVWHIPRLIMPRTLEIFIRDHPYAYDRNKITHEYYKYLACKYHGDEQWFTLNACNRATGIGKETITKAIRAGELPVKWGKFGGKMRAFFKKSDLMDFVRSTRWTMLNAMKPEFRRECGI